MKKPCIRSPLDLLTLHQKQALIAWLTTGGPHKHGVTYAEAVKRLASEFGIKTSHGAICAFYHRSQLGKTVSTQPRMQTHFDQVAKTITIILQFTPEPTTSEQ